MYINPPKGAVINRAAVPWTCRCFSLSFGSLTLPKSRGNTRGEERERMGKTGCSWDETIQNGTRRKGNGNDGRRRYADGIYLILRDEIEIFLLLELTKA